MQVSTPSLDAHGQPIDAWATHCVRWAEVKNPESNDERFISSERLMEIKHQFVVRFDPKTRLITPKMQISWDSRVFDINSVINVKVRDREIHMTATEKV